MSSKLSSLILSKKRNIIYRSRQFLSRASNDDNNVPAISNMKTAGIIGNLKCVYDYKQIIINFYSYWWWNLEGRGSWHELAPCNENISQIRDQSWKGDFYKQHSICWGWNEIYCQLIFLGFYNRWCKKWDFPRSKIIF